MEEREHVRIELLVESLAVEIRCISADFGENRLHDGRGVEHEVGEALDVGRPLDKGRQRAGAARIESGIAGMIDGGDDTAGVGQRFGGIAMQREVAAEPQNLGGELLVEGDAVEAGRIPAICIGQSPRPPAYGVIELARRTTRALPRGAPPGNLPSRRHLSRR